MDKTFEELKSIDWFFYYGLGDLSNETKHDIIMGAMQPRRSMIYNRGMGAGAAEYENYPSSFAMQIGIRYDIIAWIARRNTQVTNGSNETRDRRAWASQNTISVTPNGRGDVDVSIYYIAAADFQSLQNLSVPTGVGAVR